MAIKRKGCKPAEGKSSVKIIKPPKNILKMIEKNKQGIRLDIGCGSNKQKGFLGMDIRAVDGVDIVHDVEDTPYPLPDECCQTLLTSHLIEHICPRFFLTIINEWWRILKPHGQLWIGIPYGKSFGFQQDPTHCNPWNEATPTYFSPRMALYGVYQPKPWEIIKNVWYEHGNMEIILEKMTEEEGKKCKRPPLQ